MRNKHLSACSCNNMDYNILVKKFMTLNVMDLFPSQWALKMWEGLESLTIPCLFNPTEITQVIEFAIALVEDVPKLIKTICLL
ncbi:hypothetical protein CFP56_011482 [Quercus suber]|uniref:Uncharacterized protein n=1 Tax=Quercus suber TaxID=58331 RepID=A0AAW0M6W9_QUESU